MAIRYFEDFTEGQVIDLGPIPTLSEADIIEFGRQYDPQVFHTDPVAAKDTIYGGLIASGWQTALLTMRVLVDQVLSQAAAQGSPGLENLHFKKPVRPGDRLTARYTVLATKPSSTRPDRGRILGRTELFNEAGEVVFSVDGWTLMGRRPPESTGQSPGSTSS